MVEKAAGTGKRQPRYHQTFYTGQVDAAGERRLVLARIKAVPNQTIVSFVLGQVCPLVDYTKDGWAGGRIDPDIPRGEEERVMKMLAETIGAEITVLDKGQVLGEALEVRAGKAIADIVLGPRLEVLTPLPEMLRI